MHFHDKSQVYKARHAIRSTFYDSPPNQISRRNTISVPCARRESGAWSKISKGSPSECLARMRASQDAELSRLPRHLNAQLTIIRWDGDEMRRELSFWLSLTARSVSYERYLAPTIIVKETVLARRPAYKVPSPGHGRINEDLRHSVGERDGSSRPRGSGCDASEERLLNYNFFKIYGNATPLFYHYSALPIFFSSLYAERCHSGRPGNTADGHWGIRTRIWNNRGTWSYAGTRGNNHGQSLGCNQRDFTTLNRSSWGWKILEFK